jgi:hypothetical protein
MMTNNPFGSSAAGTAGRVVRRLPAQTDSLARLAPTGLAARSLCVLSQHGGVQAGPESAHRVTFGRDETTVDVPIGLDDPTISRVHGSAEFDGRTWWLTNTGTLPIRFPGTDILLTGQQEPLSAGYTPLYIRSGVRRRREHVIEVVVTERATGSAGGPAPAGAHRSAETVQPRGWELNDVEKLVLVSLAQSYLSQVRNPQPQTWRAVVEELRELRPDSQWTERVVQGRVLGVRKRLHAAGVPGLRGDEIEPPVGNAINHNLIMALVDGLTLTARDLALLYEP